MKQRIYLECVTGMELARRRGGGAGTAKIRSACIHAGGEPLGEFFAPPLGRHPIGTERVLRWLKCACLGK